MMEKSADPNLAFMSEHSSLYFLKTEQLTSSQFGTMSGYDAGGWDIARNEIVETIIHHSSGLKCPMHKKFEPHMKCPYCMSLEDLPKLKDRAKRTT
jgi:hypothetical protein